MILTALILILIAAMATLLSDFPIVAQVAATALRKRHENRLAVFGEIHFTRWDIKDFGQGAFDVPEVVFSSEEEALSLDDIFAAMPEVVNMSPIFPIPSLYETRGGNVSDGCGMRLTDEALDYIARDAAERCVDLNQHIMARYTNRCMAEAHRRAAPKPEFEDFGL